MNQVLEHDSPILLGSTLDIAPFREVKSQAETQDGAGQKRRNGDREFSEQLQSITSWLLLGTEPVPAEPSEGRCRLSHAFRSSVARFAIHAALLPVFRWRRRPIPPHSAPV